MKPISSRENPLYKELKLLASSSQARRKAGRTLLDGAHLCQSYLQHVGMPPLCVISEGSLAHPEIAAIVQRCEEARVQCIVLPEALYQALSQVEHGVGLMFVRRQRGRDEGPGPWSMEKPCRRSATAPDVPREAMPSRDPCTVVLLSASLPTATARSPYR